MANFGSNLIISRRLRQLVREGPSTLEEFISYPAERSMDHDSTRAADAASPQLRPT